MKNDLEVLKSRIGLELPDVELKEILYHSSYQPQMASLREKNKNYAAWGTSIIKAAYAISEYTSNKLLKVGEFSKRIDGIRETVWMGIYNRYSLEDFVIKASGEYESQHPEIVSKLVTLIYQHCGFIKACDFLAPFFKNNNPVLDYKTLIQNYAQSIKLTPVYNLLYETGPDNDKEFVYKLSVGNRSAIGKGGSKKKAEKAAAEKYINTFKIPAQKEKNGGDRKQGMPEMISEQRTQQLQEAIGLLKIDQRYVNYHQINEAFTHKSYVNEHRYFNMNSNDCLSITGAYVLLMLCNDYLFKKYGASSVSYIKERGILIDEKNLIKAIPDSALQYLLTSNNLFDNTNAKAMDRLKIDILKSLLAVLWINYCNSGKAEIRDYAVDFSFKIFEQAEEFKIQDYRTLLQEVLQQYGLNAEESCELLPGLPENVPAFYAIYMISTEDWKIKAGGYGNSKKVAKNNASKSALIQMLPYFEGEDVFDTIQKTVDIAIEDILAREEE